MKAIISEKYEALRDYLLTVPSLMTSRQGEAICQKRNEVRRMEHVGHVFIVKQYRRPNLFQRFVYSFFRPSKAKRAYRNAELFRQKGIETPREVAYFEVRRQGLFADSWFVSEEAKGTETHLLLREVQDFSHALADAVMQQVAAMHQQGILHGDLNLSNFLCTEDETGYHFSIIDTNRSHFCQGWPSRRQCLNNMVRLTHRRDLYAYLIGSYARQRGWNESETVETALRLLHRFEHRLIR